MWKQVILVCFVLACAIPALGFTPSSSGDSADFPELADFFAGIELLQRREAGDKTVTFEPDTKWLKTCAGWIAQELCSSVFGAGLPEAVALEEDVGFVLHNFGNYWMDYTEKSVVGSCRVTNPQNQTYKSFWRQGLGCTLVERLTETEIRAQDVGDQTPPPALDPNVPWPVGEGFFPDQAPPGVDLQCLARVAAPQFIDPRLNTRAIVISFQGSLVFEQYGSGITKDNRLLGWSATKSITQSLIGILVHDGLLNIYNPAKVEEWYETPGDPRQNITVDMMLRMSSGTRWVGDIFPTTECIFWSDANCAHTSALKPLVEEPDTVWNYNSGSSYILSRVVLETRGDRQLSNFEWPKRRLFYPIGAHSMYIEYQPNTYFLGGSYGYATGRDWARFGLLHSRDGVWVDGTRLLPAGWAKYSSTPSTSDTYGAHFWRSPSVDPDLFIASGFRNQNVFIFPRQQIVVARLAMPNIPFLAAFDSNAFLTDILGCFTTE